MHRRSNHVGVLLSKNQNDSQKKSKDFFEGLFVALIAALIIRQFIVGSYFVPTGSMENTIMVGDFLLVNKFNYGMRTPDWIGIPFTDIGFSVPWVRIPGFKKPKPHDVVVFRYPLNTQIDYIKRCIATEGQTLEIIDKKVRVDGKEYGVPEHAKFLDSRVWRRNEGRYVFPTFNHNKYGSRDNFGPLKIPENSYFMMGDNRDNSSDSRQWGFAKFEHVVGEAIIIYFSWDKTLPMSRLFKKIRFNRMATIIR